MSNGDAIEERWAEEMEKKGVAAIFRIGGGGLSTFSSRVGDESVETSLAAFGETLRLQSIHNEEGSEMKRIVMLALIMIVGGYGAAQAQTQTETKAETKTKMFTEEEATEREETARREMEEVTEMEEATNQFLGLEWGLGVGVMGVFGSEAAIEKASLVDAGTTKILHVEEEGDFRPQVFMEMHVFVDAQARAWRKYERWKEQVRMAEVRNGPKVEEQMMPEPPTMGVGPFIAVQGGDNEAINALALGIMWGFRRDPQKPASLNLGIGLSFDPSVQVLGKGMKEGEPLPNNETAVRLKKEGQLGWAVMASFTF